MPKLKFFLLIFIIPLLFIAGISLALNLNKEFVEIKFEDNSIIAEVARTSFARVRGLSERETLAQNGGMLFVFEEEGYHGIWMKDMNFPLDILWLNKGRVVDLVKNVPQQGDTPDVLLSVYTPDSPAEYVLELNTGMADKMNIGIGSAAQILF